jgi:LCP family protein required for cell wall assembly
MSLMRRAVPLLLAASLSGCATAAPTPSPPLPTATTGAAATASPEPTEEPTAAPTAEPTDEPTDQPTEAPTEAPTIAPTPSPTVPPLGVEDVVGSDGRLTVLILGSDHRPRFPGYRTDAMIVMTIDPSTGDVVGVSLPRDTVAVPIGPGRVFGERINGLMQGIETNRGSRDAAGKGMKTVLGYTFGVEIDHYVFMEFGGFEAIVEALGGVDVVLEEPLVDPSYHHPGQRKRGVRFTAGRNHLEAMRALAFVRTRKTDSDYQRSFRQQQVIAAAATAIRERGAAVLPSLVALAVDGRILTDIPLDAVPALFELLGRARLDRRKAFVLSPYVYADDGEVLYTTVLRMDVVRRLFDRHFAPVQ